MQQNLPNLINTIQKSIGQYYISALYSVDYHSDVLLSYIRSFENKEDVQELTPQIQQLKQEFINIRNKAIQQIQNTWDTTYKTLKTRTEKGHFYFFEEPKQARNLIKETLKNLEQKFSKLNLELENLVSINKKIQAHFNNPKPNILKDLNKSLEDFIKNTNLILYLPKTLFSQ